MMDKIRELSIPGFLVYVIMLVISLRNKITTILLEIVVMWYDGG
jgi:hypothetical protein